jgi:protein N-terminal methyltransferase
MASQSEPPPPDALIDHASALQYWNSIPSTVNGMLGGFPQISRIDLRGSANFLAKVRRLLQIEGDTTAATTTTTTSAGKSFKLRRGVDCGAGIGRVTQGFLSKVCRTVDVVEPVDKFARVIREEGTRLMKRSKDEEEEEEEEDQNGVDERRVVEHVYITGLENWTPTETYDLIWAQWCVGHLTDAQLVGYLRRAADALAPNGLVVLKENNSTDPEGRDVYDELDNAVTRTDASFRRIFREAGLVLFRSEEQLGFPKHLNLLPVRYYALRRAT